MIRFERGPQTSYEVARHAAIELLTKSEQAIVIAPNIEDDREGICIRSFGENMDATDEGRTLLILIDALMKLTPTIYGILIDPDDTDPIF